MLKKIKNWIKVNMKKILLIFIVGFFSRMFVNYSCSINVFIDFTNFISIVYYSFFACFVVFSNEIISYFSLQSIFSLIKSLFTTNLASLKLSNIILNIRKLLQGNKMYLNDFNSNEIKEVKDISNKISLILSKNDIVDSKSYKDSKTYSAPVNSAAISSIRQVNNSSNDNSRLVNHYNFDHSRNQPIQHFTDGHPVYYPLSEASITNSDLLSQNSRSVLFQLDSVSNSNPNPYSRYSYSSSNYSRSTIVPRAPVLSNITTPSTMTPLFGNSTETLSRRELKLNNSDNTSTRVNCSVTNKNLPHIDKNLDDHRRKSDYASFQPRNISEVDLEDRKERIAKNVRRGIIKNMVDNISDVNEDKSCLPKKSSNLVNKLGSKVKDLDKRLEEWDKKEQAKYQEEWKIYEENYRHRSKLKAERNRNRHNSIINQPKKP